MPYVKRRNFKRKGVSYLGRVRKGRTRRRTRRTKRTKKSPAFKRLAVEQHRMLRRKIHQEKKKNPVRVPRLIDLLNREYKKALEEHANGGNVRVL